MIELVPADGPPLMNGAGVAKTVDDVMRLAKAPTAAVLVGSYTKAERSGNAGEVYYSTGGSALNTLGIPSPSVSTWSRTLREMRSIVEDHGKLLWVSVAGFTAAEAVELADIALASSAHVVEINLGCPNIWSDGSQKPILSYDLEVIATVLDGLDTLGAQGNVGIKLSPILDMSLIESISDLVRGRKSHPFITAINTVPNCYAITPSGRPGLTFGRGLGGMSGAAVKWLAQGQVCMYRDLLPHTPIIGVGGIRTGLDLQEFMSEGVGASICQVTTALLDTGPEVFAQILQDYEPVA